MSADKLHIKPSEGPCDVHAWPTEGLGAALVKAMRERHGKGGVNVCVACLERAIERARDDLAASRPAGQETR